MSAPLTQAILQAGATMHTLKRARLEDLLLDVDLQTFRAPFGTRWHKLGNGHAEPELINLSGAVEAATLTLSQAALDALHADLPAVTTLHLGTWALPVLGNTGPVIITPTLAGWRIQLTLVRAP